MIGEPGPLTDEDLAIIRAARAPANPNGQQAETLNLRWAHETHADPPPEPPILVDGLLRAGELAVLVAPRALGKSWLTMNLAIVLGRGTGLLAGTMPVRRQARVLIAQGEINEWEAARRWHVLTGTEGPPDTIGETFDRWRIRTEERTTTLRHDLGVDVRRQWDATIDERLEETIVEHGFDVLAIDPWAVYYSGRENSNDEAEAALDKLRAISLKHGTAILINHHISKSFDIREPEDAWRGASRLADWASTRVTITPHYTTAQYKAQGMTREQARRYADVTLLHRSLSTVGDFSMVREDGWWRRWTPPGEAGGEGVRLPINPPDVAQTLEETGGTWQSIVEAATALGCSHTTAKKLLTQTAHAGLIERIAGAGAKGADLWQLPAATLHDDPNETF